MAFALLGSSVFAAVAAAAASPDDKFAAWRHVHKKVYLTSAEEAAARRNFAMNDALIQQHLSKDSSFELGHNAYSDQDLASLASRRNGFVASAKLGGARRRHTPRSHSSLPAAVDWASAGAVSPVKDQGTCGSCWSFAATGAIEASLYVDRGVSTSLSEEQLIDCDKGAPQDGCKGGAIEEAFRWVRRRRRAIRRNSAQFSERPYIHSPRRSTPTAASSPRASTRTLRAQAAPPASAAPPIRRCSPL